MNFSNKTANRYAWLFLLVVLAIPLIVPEGLNSIAPTVYKLIYIYWRKIAEIGIVFLLLFFTKRQKLSSLTTSMLIFIVVSFLINVIHGGNFAQWKDDFFTLALTCILLESYKNKLTEVLDLYNVILLLFVLINLLCIIKYPNGMYISKETNYYQNWFLGYKSSLQYYVIPLASISWLKMKYSGKRIVFLLTMLLCLVEAYLSENSMLLVAFLLILIFAFVSLPKVTVLFNIRNYVIAIVAANIILVLFNTWFVRTKLGSSILFALGKGSTLTWRASVIWPNTVDYISKNLFSGVGVWRIDDRRAIYSGVYGAIHAHNQFLEVLFIGGIILLLVYVLMHYFILKKMNIYSDLNTSQVLAASVFVIYIMCTVEVFLRPIASPIWLIILCGFYCKELDLQLKTKYSSSKYKRRSFVFRKKRMR